MIWEDHCLSDTSTLPGLTVVTKYLCLASATIQHIPLLSLQSRAYIWTQPSDFFFPVIGLGTLPVITVFTVPGIVSCQGGPAEEFFFLSSLRTKPVFTVSTIGGLSLLLHLLNLLFLVSSPTTNQDLLYYLFTDQLSVGCTISYCFCLLSSLGLALNSFHKHQGILLDR